MSIINLELSNYEVKAYKNGKGNYNFHLDTMLMVESNTNFSFYSYLKYINIKTLFNDCIVAFDEYSLSEWGGVKYDGRILTARYHGKYESEMMDFIPTPIIIEIEYHFSFTGHESETSEIIRKNGIVTKGYR